jgi:hypothetical protein
MVITTNLWNSIGISQSGLNIVACCKETSNYIIQYSKDYGNTFNKSLFFSSSESVNGISVSNNGYVVMYTKTNIYISLNNGITFTQIFTPLNTPINSNNYWNGVSISSNGGQYIVACLGGIGNIYISTSNSDWNIVPMDTSRNYTGISISETGKYIVACYASNNIGGIYTSSNYGGTWVLNQTIPTNSINWSSVCIKESYGFAIAGDASGTIYTSTNYGNIWTNTITTTNKIKKVCISNYGYAIALSDLQILVTANYGETWAIHSNFNSPITDIGVSTIGLLVICNSTNIYSSSIYSYFNSPNIYYSTDISFVSKGLLYNQLQITNILDNQFTINFPNPIILPQEDYQLYITNHTTKNNISIPVVITNNLYSIPITNLSQNTLYDISLQSIYSNVVSTIYKTQYTKGAPEPSLIECNPDYITDVSMIVSFINCPITPNNGYHIYIQNKGNITDKQDIYLSNEYITEYLSQYQDSPIVTTIYNLLPDSDYTLTIVSKYSDDISYSSVFNKNVINTKSAPNNISYTLTNGNVTILYGHPSYVDPPYILLILQNITNNASPITSLPQSLLTSYTFTDLSVNATYNVSLESKYDNMVIKSNTITFTNVGKPKIISSYRFDSFTKKYVIITNIYLASIPNYSISITYPNGYIFKSDLPQYATSYNLNGISILGQYTIVVNALFDTEYVSDPFILIVNEHPIIKFEYIDMSYSFINIPYKIKPASTSPPQYTLYLINTIYPNIYDQSYNIILNSTGSYTTKFNTYTGTGNYNIYISDSLFYSDYVNITIPEIVTIVYNDIYPATIINQTSGNQFTVYYNLINPISNSSYTLFVDNNISNPNISFSNSVPTDSIYPNVKQLSVTINVIGTMDYYIINYFPNGSIYRTPTRKLTIDSKTSIEFGNIDITYNSFIVPTIINTFAYRPRYNISISGSFFTSLVAISPTTVISNNNTKFNVYANTGIYFITLTDGISIYQPSPSYITLSKNLTTLSDISYTFTTNTNMYTNTNTNNLLVSYYILNTYLPTYTLYLKNQDNSDISFSTFSDISFIPSRFIASNRFTINLTDKITRSGNYLLYISHKYIGVSDSNNITNFTYTSSPINNIFIDISNIVVINIGNTNKNSILVNYQIKSFNIYPLKYTLYLQSNSFSQDLNYSYIIPNSSFQSNLYNYTTSNNITGNFEFSNIYVNTGNYKYFVIDSCGNRYNAVSDYTLPTQLSTLSFVGDLSVNIFTIYNVNNKGSISTLYNINNESYKPTYTLVATNTTINSIVNCIYYSDGIYMDNSSTIIKRAINPYSITISNIYRTGIYSVYLQNNYNGNSSIETTSTKDIYLYLPNDVSYQSVSYDISSITIPFIITSYDISDVIYTISIDNIQYPEINYNKQFTITNNNKYTEPNILYNTISFQDLYVNIGDFSYKIYNNNGMNYSGVSLISLPSTNTIRYISGSLKPNSLTTSYTINASYYIDYISYNPIYKMILIHNIFNDCSYSIINENPPTKYTDLNKIYILNITNICRKGIYTVVLQNIYNNTIEQINISSTVDITLNNNVIYPLNQNIYDFSCITIPFSIESYDVSLVQYTLFLSNDNYSSDISYNQSYIVLNNNRNFTSVTNNNSTIIFKNLYANSGTYNYIMRDNNGNKYNIYTTPKLPNITTIILRDLSSTIFNTYSATNNGSITARYDIAYISYKPTYYLYVTHSIANDCSYSISTSIIPNQYIDIQNSYFISVSNIYRTGIYHVYLNNIYSGDIYEDKTNIIDISVNLPNNINYQTITTDVSSINISLENICYDISNVYTVTIINSSVTTDICYNQKLLIQNNYIYTSPIISTKNIIFTNLFANTGNYYYYVSDLNGNKYPSMNSVTNQVSLSLSDSIKTIHLKDLSSTMFSTYYTTNIGSITAMYDISYITYKPTYTLQVIHSTSTDCNYSTFITDNNIPSDYSQLKTLYSLSISNIYRTGLYNVYLKNTYNNGQKTEQFTKDISVNLPNTVSYNIVTATTTSIAIPFTITSFDINTTNYTLYVKNTVLDLSENKTFQLITSNDYTQANTLTVLDFSFQNLSANTGDYYYYFTNSNGINYPSNTELYKIALTALDNTIIIMDLSSTMYSTYSVTNIGSITARYQIIAKSNAPTYTLIATSLTDFSYSVSITNLNIPSNLNTDNYLSILPIYRTGKYKVQLQNKYVGGIKPEYSNQIDISVNLPNSISYGSVSSDISAITIPEFKITSFDINQVTYTIYITNNSIQYSATKTYNLPTSNIYSAPNNSDLIKYTFADLVVNTLNPYNYYVMDSNNITYPGNSISLKSVTNTITLLDVTTNTQSITAKYNVLYITYNSKYKVIITNTTLGTTDCTYSSLNTAGPTTYSSITNHYNLTSPTIYRSGMYNVVLQNTYNTNSLEPPSPTKNILINISNIVTYNTSSIKTDISAITIPFTITSYDISNVQYDVKIQSVSYPTLIYDQSFILNNNTTNYNAATTYSDNFTFANLFVNTGNYNYFITNTNGMTYSGSSAITLSTVNKTLTLIDLSSTMYSTYSLTNNGSITARYTISYISYNPTYKITAINSFNGLNDCYYSNNITTNIPTQYTDIKNTSYYLSVSNIKRNGIYHVYLENINGYNEQTSTIDISVNLPNNVLNSTITYDISSATIPLSFIYYDISNIYTVNIKNDRYTDISYSQSFTLLGSNDYTTYTTSEKKIIFNYYANIGNHNYTISDITGKTYLTNTFTVPSPIFTVSLRDVSQSIITLPIKYGKITSKYDISYISYKPTYTMYATNQFIGMSDCSYSIKIPDLTIPKYYTSISNPYSIDISNIYRSGTYRVYLQNIDGSGNIENTATKDISLNIPTDVSFIQVATDNSYSIDISFQITSYDISFMNYTLYIQHKTQNDISLNQIYPLYPTRNYTEATTSNIQYNRFQYLTLSGSYNYFVIDSCNNRYDGSSIYVNCNNPVV